MTGMWQDLMTSGIPLVEKVARTIVVYAFLVAGLRLFGKRELGQLNPLDFIVLLLLSNTVQNAIIGNDNSLLGGLIGAGVLFIINDILVRVAYRRPKLRRFVEGRPELLIHGGRVIKAAIERNFITKEELVVAARKQGIEHLRDVESARLEISGTLSFTLREPSGEDMFHTEVLKRLAAIEKRLPAVAPLLLVAFGTLGTFTALAALAAATTLVTPRTLRAQAIPSTDVWIAPMHQAGNTIHIGEPRNVTKRMGYDNQPSFTADSKSVLYTAIGDDKQADTWRFALPNGKPQRVTNTPESEYSPTVTPDGVSFSVIRVEADSAQRLWRFPLTGGGTPSLVLEKIKPVGYHAWVGDHTLVLFVLGAPATLQLADERTGEAEVVATNIGRALVKVPGRAAATFVQMVPDSGQWIAELDVRTKAVRRLMRPPEGADYHAWTPDGALIAAAGSSIYQWVDGKWDQVADLGRWGARGITRIAVSPKGDWLAFVAEDQRAP